MSAPGLVLSSRYRLGQRIAVGGMGEVWTADDIRLARIVALKILRPELTGDPEFVERFRTEARITASLNHPGICAVYDYGEVSGGVGPYLGGTAYLVMELIAGESLSSVLARTGRLSAPRTLDVVEQTGRALQEAHSRSLVHRDIKPGNLLITPAGLVKITDFGIAKVAHQAPVTRMGMVMGTAQYISPEQAAGQEAVPASDVYSLGVVAYECLAGTLPFPNENAVAMALAHVRDAPRPLPPDVPPAIAALVMQMLLKDPAARYENGATLVQAVGRLRAGAHAARPGQVTPPRTRIAPVVPAPVRPAAGAQPAATRVQQAQPVPVATAGARRPPSSPGTATADRQPAPRPAAGPGGGTHRPSGRRTGLSVLLAVVVLVLAVLVLVLVNQVMGQLSAAPIGAGPNPTNGTLNRGGDVSGGGRPGGAVIGVTRDRSVARPGEGTGRRPFASTTATTTGAPAVGDGQQ